MSLSRGLVLPPASENRSWALAGGIAVAAHVAAIATVVTLVSRPADTVPQPVMVVELPPEGIETAALPAAAPQAVAQPQSRPEPVAPSASVPPPIEVPPTRDVPPTALALPTPTRKPVALTPPAPRPRPAPVAAPKAAASAPAATAANDSAGAPDSPGTNPRAKKAEVDYYSLLSAHLNRRKNYPTEAKKAKQQGIVTVRFTVARSGDVSGVSIKKSSGHELLDAATIDLLRRVAPLPRFPRSMDKDSVTIALPIEYSLRTS